MVQYFDTTECNSCYYLYILIMGKELDDLVLKYNREFSRDYNTEHTRGTSVSAGGVIKKNRRLLYYYSDLLDVAEKLKKIEEELFKDLPKEIAEEAIKVEADGNYGEYRYKVLPKLFSDPFSNNDEIVCSPNLRRKLISYYIRNRRKSKRMSVGYSNQQSVDHVLHNIYMELGRTLYFSSLGRLKGMLNSIKEYKQAILYIFSKIFRDMPSGLGYKEKVDYFMSHLALGAIFLYQQVAKEYVKLPEPNLDPPLWVKVIMIIGLAITGGFFTIFVVSGLLTAVEDTWIGALMRFIINVIVGIFKIGIALLFLIPFGIVKLIALLALAIREKIKHEKSGKDEEKTLSNYKNEEFIKEAVELLSTPVKGTEYLKIIEGNSDFLKYTELKRVIVTIKVYPNRNINDLISKNAQKDITIPSVMEFKASKVIGKDVQLLSEDRDNLPTSIKALLVVTSPEMQINIKADENNIIANFNVFECLKKYGKIDNNMIVKFVKSYLELSSDISDQEIIKALTEGQASQS
jgi:hypothetical protein